MRHRVAGKKLGRTASHRKALYRNLMIEMIEHGHIRTTITKAKAIQPYVESIIAMAREDTPHTRRLALSKLASKTAMRRLFVIGPNYVGRDGGYTRLTRLGVRKGDGAEMALLELV